MKLLTEYDGYVLELRPYIAYRFCERFPKTPVIVGARLAGLSIEKFIEFVVTLRTKTTAHDAFVNWMNEGQQG